MDAGRRLPGTVFRPGAGAAPGLALAAALLTPSPATAAASGAAAAGGCELESHLTVFADGFESGTTSAWSLVMP